MYLELIDNKDNIEKGDLVVFTDALHNPTMKLGIVVKINTKFLSCHEIIRTRTLDLVLANISTRIAKNWCKVDVKGFPLEYQEFYKTIR